MFLFVRASIDHQVKTLNRRVVELMGFDKWIPVSGQTYSRKIDYQVRCEHATYLELCDSFVCNAPFRAPRFVFVANN